MIKFSRPEQRSLECEKRGKALGKRPRADDRRIELTVYVCGEYGLCTLNKRAEDVEAVCRDCETIAPPNGSPPKIIPAKEGRAGESRHSCIHEGRVLERTDGTGEPCSCEGKWVFACDLHGRCTRTKAGLREGVTLCSGS